MANLHSASPPPLTSKGEKDWPCVCSLLKATAGTLVPTSPLMGNEMTPPAGPGAQPPALVRSGGVVLPPLDITPLRVLCVDDNLDAVQSLGMLLDMLGFEASTCLDTDSALVRYDRFCPEVCILDLDLPQIGGFALGEILRSRATASGKALYLIAVTAFSDHNTQRRTAEVGFDLHLTKPVEPQLLIDCLYRYQRCIRAAQVGE